MEVAYHGHCYSKVSLGNPFPSTPIRKRHALGKKRMPSKRRVVLNHTVRIHSQAGFGRGTLKIKEEEEEIETQESEPSSGTKKLFNFPVPSKLPGTVKLQNKSQSQPKSNRVVFVAGASGKVGSRTVRELLKLGFNVRASTRNVEKAQALFEGAEQNDAAGSDDGAPFGIFSPAKLFGFLKPKVAGKKLEIVECDLENPESIETALGNAGVVVCCIGASEKEVLDWTGPYRIDFKATENLIKTASSAEVSHFVLVTSLGTQKFGFPAAVLNLFWGVLVWKAKAEKALIQSGIPYTIVRPGGMERPTDAYKETHNLILAEADKLFGGQVSNLQVAELLASIVENPDVSVNKIVEAIAETTAPLRPIRELLEEIPAKEASSSAPQSIRKAQPAKADVNAQKASKKQEEERLAQEKRFSTEREKEQKRIQAERDEKEKLKLQELRKKYEEEFEAAREEEEAAKSAAAAALAEKAELEKKATEIRAKVEAAALAASQAKAVEAAVLAAARKGGVLSDEEKQKIMESVRLARLPKEATPADKPEPSSKKRPPFSFFGRAAPSSTTTKTATETEPSKEEEREKVKVEAESKVKPKADIKAVADKKQKEDILKKEEEAKKLAEAKEKEEQERSEKEANELAEKQAVEAKQKEEAEAKKKEEEAEAKKKEEEEIAKKEAEAEAIKKEEEEKAKKVAEAEAKRKEEELAEAKKRDEEEKAEAEAKRKEEELAEAKKRTEEEKAKKEEEMLKAQAEEKAKALAEQEAVNVTAAEEEEKEEAKETQASRQKGFRWFWQPAEPEEEVADVQESTQDKVPDVPVQAEVADQLPPCPTPLSPYTRYPGLKPPSPPIASPPASKAESPTAPKAEKVADVTSPEINSKEQTTAKVELPPQEEPALVTEDPVKESQEDIEARKQQIQETEAREREALEKAQAAITFKWFWQKSETTGEESAATLKEEEPAAAVEAATSVPEEAAVPRTTQSEEKTNELPRSSRPLSPYAQFPNLKPPSPPKAFSAPQNGSVTLAKPVETLPTSSTPLSPYTGFPGLKPPTSPGPLAENGSVPVISEQEEEKAAEPTVSSGFKWPWQQ